MGGNLREPGGGGGGGVDGGEDIEGREEDSDDDGGVDRQEQWLRIRYLLELVPPTHCLNCWF